LQERHAYIRAKEVVQNEREKASRRLLESHATARVMAIVQNYEEDDDWEHRRSYVTSEGGRPPPLRAAQGPTDKPRVTRRQGIPSCYLCKTRGHEAGECEEPHYKCRRDRKGYCVIKQHHTGYDYGLPSSCSYGGVQRNGARPRNMPTRRSSGDSMAEAQDQGNTLYEDRGSDQ
jgi:hypothetical protein